MRPGGATWRSGYAAVCKTVYTSSILVVASNSPFKRLHAEFLAELEPIPAGAAFEFTSMS